MSTGSDDDVCFFCKKKQRLIRIKCKTVHVDCIPCFAGNACECKVHTAELEKGEEEKHRHETEQKRETSLYDFFVEYSAAVAGIRDYVREEEERQTAEKKHISVTGHNEETSCFKHRNCVRACLLPPDDCLLLQKDDKEKSKVFVTREAQIRMLRIDDPGTRTIRIKPTGDVSMSSKNDFFGSGFRLFDMDRRTPLSPPTVSMFSVPLLQSTAFKDAQSERVGSENKLNRIMRITFSKLTMESNFPDPQTTTFR